MQRHITLEYWRDGDHYAGRVKEIPGIVGEGASLETLEENILEACRAMVDIETRAARQQTETKSITFEVYYAPPPD